MINYYQSPIPKNFVLCILEICTFLYDMCKSVASPSSRTV